jgi:hypothetical protein
MEAVRSSETFVPNYHSFNLLKTEAAHSSAARLAKANNWYFGLMDPVARKQSETALRHLTYSYK